MALDPNIILQARPMDLGQVGDSFLKGAQVGSNIAGQKSQIETQKLQNQLTEQQISDARFKNLDAREQSRLRSVILGSAELKNYLDSNNTEGAKSFLLNRRANLQKRIAEGDNVDTTETDEALQMLDKNPKQLRQNVDQLTKFGQQLGVLSDPRANEAELNLKNAQAEYYNKKATQPDYGGATGTYAYKIMQDNPGMKFEDAFYIAQTGNRIGVTVKNGAVVPIQGLEDAKNRLKQAEAKGTEIGKSEGEALALLTSQLSKLPQLEQTVEELHRLGQKATYTLAGQAQDAIRNQITLDPRPSAVARTEYISLVDNQILPLLRDTFGAQFTLEEGKSLKKTLGDPNLNPQQKDAVLRAFITQKKANIESLQRQVGNQTSTAPQQNTNTQNQQNQVGQVYTTRSGVNYYKE